ncbi:2Fe-2S iron-sulfur cluster-binding protein [Streptomyces sp. NPDC001940]
MEPIDAAYGLLVDNLMDLSHETYLHGGYIGTPEVADTPMTTEVDEGAGIVRVGRHMDDAECPPFYANSTGIKGRITRWQDIEYHAPCLYLLHSRIAPQGVLPNPDGTDPDAFHVEITYAITPSTPDRVYDFWAVSRDFGHGDEEMLLPMLAASEAAGAEWSLLYGGRTRGAMAFLGRLSAYGAKVRLAPEDETGLLDLDRYLCPPDPDGGGTLVYCCGPGPLLDAVEARGAAHTERFRTAQDGPDGADGTDHAFVVELRRSGHTLTVPPGRSILHTVREAGVEVLYSCAEGTCGNCETDIVEGAADHRDSVLTAQERAADETLMICVSRCLGPRLVLDM